LKKYLIAGLLVWLPLTITVWVLTSVLGVLDGLFGVCTRLFGVRIERADGEAEVWNPDASDCL
jgi:uncharacterized membrane protein